ncbi:MAG: DUF4118 domain-containing protein [Solobacterium sp.]|nr:DUF4118 domain-containing protein [Solobacterium sp.]
MSTSNSAEHILVCISPSPSNPRIIRAAGRTAAALSCRFTALYVKRTGVSLSEADKLELDSNISLAKRLGADFETVEGRDIAFEIAEYARISDITEIFIGNSPSQMSPFSKPPLTIQLMRYVPDVEIHVIPDSLAETRNQYNVLQKPRITAKDLGRTLLIMAGATGICWLIYLSRYENANIITIYILASLIVSVRTADRIYGIISAAISFILFNFLFTEPRFTLAVYDTRYLVTYFVMFIASIIAGTLASRLKANAVVSAANAYRTRVLLETNELLQETKDSEEIIRITSEQLVKLLHRDVVFYPVNDGRLQEAKLYSSSENSGDDYKNEIEVAQWVMENNRRAGAKTDKFPDARFLYLAVRANSRVYGVIGIDIGRQNIDTFEDHILLSLIAECALSMENMLNVREREHSEIKAEKEKFRADLLRSISHDFRTPLTSIIGNASNLSENAAYFSTEEVQKISSDICEDSEWLIEMSENLLSVTKLESGVRLNMTTELVDDVIEEALNHADRHKDRHRIIVETSQEYLLAKMDVKLIVQVLINVINNAVKYSPDSSEIRITAEKKGDKIEIAVTDNGPGIAEEDKDHVFDAFYTGRHTADSHRSLGLGLSLCRSIVEAHGETIWAENVQPHGTRIAFTLKSEEVTVDGAAENTGG